MKNIRLPADLIIAKLHIFSFDMSSLMVMQNYSTDRQQKVKVNSYYENRSLVKCEVHQGSVLVSTLFLTYFCLNRLFWLIQEILQVMLTIILSIVLEKTNMELKTN